MKILSNADLLHHGDEGGQLVADVSVVTRGGGRVAGASWGVGRGHRITNLEEDELIFTKYRCNNG